MIMVMFLGPIWIAFLVGLILGWAWKPKWATLGSLKFASILSNSSDLSSPSPPLRSLVSTPCFNSFKLRSQACESWVMDDALHKKPPSASPTEYDDCSTSSLNEERSSVITEQDLKHLWRLVEMKDGGPAWIQMMNRSTQSMSYQAWRRDPKTGPPQYRTKTIFEDASPEVVRDFFWDDEFRLKWDDMLAYSSTIEECPTTGTMIVHWIRKFPLFCSDREYIIGRRIWELQESYYCVTKGVPSPSIPRHDKPRRVDLYYSSWYIRAVESRRGNCQLSACEVLFFHHEDMGIPSKIAKLGVSQGMWGAVTKKMEPALRAYQKERACGAPLSQPAAMAHICATINPDYLTSLQGSDDDGGLPNTEGTYTPSKPSVANNISMLLILGGAIALAFSLDRGLLSNAFLCGIGRRLTNRNRPAKRTNVN